MILQAEIDVADDVASKLTAQWLMEKVTPFERDLLYLWAVEEYTLDEIGEILGQRYRGRPLTGSAMRYHKNRVHARLLKLAKSAGYPSPRARRLVRT